MYPPGPPEWYSTYGKKYYNLREAWLIIIVSPAWMTCIGAREETLKSNQKKDIPMTLLWHTVKNYTNTFYSKQKQLATWCTSITGSFGCLRMAINGYGLLRINATYAHTESNFMVKPRSTRETCNLPSQAIIAGRNHGHVKNNMRMTIPIWSKYPMSQGSSGTCAGQLTISMHFFPGKWLISDAGLSRQMNRMPQTLIQYTTYWQVTNICSPMGWNSHPNSG